MKKNILILLISLFIIGCATHNTPDTQQPNKVFSNKVEVFVDQSGIFYPNNWEENYGRPCKIYCKNKSYSLKQIAKKQTEEKQTEEKQIDLNNDLSSSTSSILNNIKKYLHDKKRIFILVHGYNNDVKESRENYKKIEDIIKFNSDDGIVEFYWDGLVGQVIGKLAVWNNACGYSQLAGILGLRQVLNQINNKEIFIISHSRGASVLLSSMSNPPFNKKFAKETKSFHGIDTVQPPLKNLNNNIHMILLAPAIGAIDFKNVNYSKGNNSFRDLGQQLKSIDYTINKKDWVLKKYLLGGKFNTTELGYKKEIGENILKSYLNIKMVAKNVSNRKHGHDFKKYIDDPEFIEILNSWKIQTK